MSRKLTYARKSIFQNASRPLIEGDAYPYVGEEGGELGLLWMTVPTKATLQGLRYLPRPQGLRASHPEFRLLYFRNAR